MMWTRSFQFLVAFVSPVVFAHQSILEDGVHTNSKLTQSNPSDKYFNFTHAIKRVAVIGAGVAGIQHAAALVDHGFEVRLFERRPNSGGVWLYSPKKPLPAAFPDAPLKVSAYVPDIPTTLPLTRIIKDGENGLSNDWRLREHWTPSGIWKNLRLIFPHRMMPLPNLLTPNDALWPADRTYAKRKVRELAASLGFSSSSSDNEHANITSYSTRVERVQKLAGSNKWTLTLRKIEILPYTANAEIPGTHDNIRVEYWTEEFDAVVVGLQGQSDAPHVPNIPGLAEWAHKFPDHVYHVREYRTPEEFAGKNVLIVGDYLSGSGVAIDLAGYAASITVSARKAPEDLQRFQRSAFQHRFPQNTSFVGAIRSFSEAPDAEVSDGAITLMNGTILRSFDYVILATGYRTSFPFLVDYHNDTIKGLEEPEVRIPPILTDGTHFRSLHWTGHYIPDPTLAIAYGDPYTLGRFQSVGFARSWSGKARLPTREQMWREYPGAGKELKVHPTDVSVASKLFVNWLNNENLEFGGRLVDGLGNANLHGLGYWMAKNWPGVPITVEHFKDMENEPRSHWPVRNGVDDDHVDSTEASSSVSGGGLEEGPAKDWTEPPFSHLW